MCMYTMCVYICIFLVPKAFLHIILGQDILTHYPMSYSINYRQFSLIGKLGFLPYDFIYIYINMFKHIYIYIQKKCNIFISLYSEDIIVYCTKKKLNEIVYIVNMNHICMYILMHVYVLKFFFVLVIPRVTHFKSALIISKACSYR